MKKTLTILALVALIAMPTIATAQTGFYSWAVSASNTVSTDNTPANPGPGVQTLYLWLTETCHAPGSAGLSAAEFDITTGGTDWVPLAFTALNGFLNAGGTTNLLLANACASGPVVAGSILVQSSANPGRVGLTLSAANSKAAGVDCDNFIEWNWPQYMRFVGYATSDGSPNQDHGTDCTTTAIEDSSWGSVKSLYR